MSLGNIPRQVDVVIGMERMAALVDHDDANLTATAQAGMRLTSFQEILGKRKQFLAVDPPRPAQATIGGLVAANVNGPRRMFYGGARDLVIGMKAALATGAGIKAGGKVVKNVAGYDMCKLFVGSLGTLGIITELTFKMAPLPESSATVLARGSLPQSLQLADELARSALLPAALAILNGNAAKAAGVSTDMAAVAVWVEGFDEAVTRHLRDLETMTGRIGLASEILRDEGHRQLWEKIRDFGASGGEVLYRLTVPLASLADVVQTVERWSVSEHPARTISHAGSGVVWILLDADPSGGAWFPRLTALAREHRGHTVMAAAPPAFKAGIDVWGPVPQSFGIMREIKRQFDPQAILSPGRFVGRL